MEHPFRVGESYFVRTVTYHIVGRVIGQVGKFLELADAAWIPISARFMNFLRDGQINESEPIPCRMWLNLESVVDAFEWNHNLPLTQK